MYDPVPYYIPKLIKTCF